MEKPTYESCKGDVTEYLKQMNIYVDIVKEQTITELIIQMQEHFGYHHTADFVKRFNIKIDEQEG